MDQPTLANCRGAIALQLWTIRDALAADADEALRRVKAAGFSAVEVAPPPEGLSPDRLADLLDRHGLAVASVHGDLPRPDTVAALAQAARSYRCPTLIWHGWPRDPRFDSLDGVRAVLASFNAAGTLARDHGLRFGIHNHWWEFEPVSGERPARLLHDGLHPDTFWQLDIYWARVAGVDPAEVLADLGPRLGSIHWKDGPAIPGAPMTALGRGTLDLSRIRRALSRPVDWVIELDECANDPLEAARLGLAYLQAPGTAPGPPGARP